VLTSFSAWYLYSVLADDFVVFKSVKYKSKKLTIALPSNDLEQFDHLVGAESNRLMPSGWQLKIILSFSFLSKVRSMDSKSRIICGGDYVRIKHLQSRGYLLSRSDDERESASVVAPLGLLARKSASSKTRTQGLYIGTEATSHIDLDSSSSSNSSEVWQITLDNPYGVGAVTQGAFVRFRSVLSGLYMCIRTQDPADDEILLSTKLGPESVSSSSASDEELILATTDKKDSSSIFQILTFDRKPDSHTRLKNIGKLVYC
jgi:hypothetical protein